MKVFAVVRGDWSVGIADGAFNLDMNIEPTDDEDRENIRKSFREFVTDVAGEPCTSVTFEDECGDCQQRLVDGKCLTRDCPSHEPVPEPDVDDSIGGRICPRCGREGGIDDTDCDCDDFGHYEP